MNEGVISANIQEMSQHDEKDSCLRTCMEIFTYQVATVITGLFRKICSQLKYVGRALTQP